MKNILISAAVVLTTVCLVSATVPTANATTYANDADVALINTVDKSTAAFGTAIKDSTVSVTTVKAKAELAKADLNTFATHSFTTLIISSIVTK